MYTNIARPRDASFPVPVAIERKYENLSSAWDYVAYSDARDQRGD